MLYLGASSRYQKIFMNLFKTVYYSDALDIIISLYCLTWGARCSSVERAFAHGAMGRWIDPS